MTHANTARQIEEPDPDGAPRCYRIIRFRFKAKPLTIKNNVSLAEAKAHCARPDTSSHSTGTGSWFDGFDYMPGCRPDEDRS